MNWYLARLVFLVKSSFMDANQHFDEQLRLLQADEPIHAFEKARHLGKQEENDQVWKGRLEFVGVPDLVRLDPPGDGMNLYSFTRETTDPEEYLTFIRRKEAFTGMNLQKAPA